MFNRIAEFWDTYGFEIVLGLSILVIFIMALIRLGKKGTWSPWSSSYYRLYPEDPESQKRRPPRESKGEIECRKVLEKIFVE